MVGTTYNPYQPKTAGGQSNIHPYYSLINDPTKKNSVPKQVRPYNRKPFNYGDITQDTKFRQTVRKNAFMLANSYNIINGLPQNQIPNFNNNICTTNRFGFTSHFKNYSNIFTNNQIQNNGVKYDNYLLFNGNKAIKPPTAPSSITQPFYNDNLNTVIKKLESESKEMNNNSNIRDVVNISPFNYHNNNQLNNINKNLKEKNKKNSFSNKTLNEKEESKVEYEEKCSDILSQEYFVENNNIVKNYAYKEDANSHYRDYMEDKGRSIENFNYNPNSILFCLFDGHGGAEVSTYLQKTIHQYMKDIFNYTLIEEGITNVFKSCDYKLRELNYYQVGSTGCIVYLTKEEGKKVLYCANIGDTRCVLINQSEAQRLSYDDRASDKQEFDRIVNENGIVFDGRVCGQLMLSRAFGDWELKPFGVSNIPHIYKKEIAEEDKFIIIACDGVWDVIRDDDAFVYSKSAKNSKELCEILIKNAKDKGSMDNISCFVIEL